MGDNFIKATWIHKFFCEQMKMICSNAECPYRIPDMISLWFTIFQLNMIVNKPV